MRIALVVPDLGTGQEPIRLSGWLVDEGDLVLAGERVVELLLPGITFEVAAEGSGTLVELTKAIDSELVTGDLLGWLDDGVEGASCEPESDLES
ncbi:biotin/lipoyl-containing protein [Schlesneria paludicola]|uniref:biotin/lipoyl-containing protein n=1 Tax=Schlesneria paludicola TaxID=360056 RepID=UPI00029ACCED|nr:biotin/lipoyl-containing protein [Schlesneria paludicola]